MRFDIALIPSLLLASAVVAGHGYHSAHRQTRSSNGAGKSTGLGTVYSDTNWGGSVVHGSFVNVTGIILVPNVSGPRDSAVTIAVGIDGAANCREAMFQAGIDVDVDINGGVTVAAWALFFPGEKVFFELEVSLQHYVRASVALVDKNFGVARIDNISTGESQFLLLTSNQTLCGMTAEWIVADPTRGSQDVLLNDFGNVVIGSAWAFDGNSYQAASLYGADIYAMKQNNQTLTYTANNVAEARVIILRV